MIITGIGAAIGALVRYNLTAFIKGKLGTNFPIETLIINLTGAFLLGIVKDTEFALLVGTGILGGYTTFSTYNVELLTLIRNKAWSKACSYFVLSGIFGPVAAFLGWYLAGLC